MKTHLLVMSLLVFSVFATGMAFAESGSGRLKALDPRAIATDVEASVTVSDVATQSGSIDAAEIASIQADLTAATAAKQKVGFAQAWPGNGWTNAGEIVHIMWISEDVAASASVDTATYSYGAVHFRSSDARTNYRLVSTTSTASDITFNVLKGNEKVGTLTVHATSTVKSLTTWEGTLTMNDGSATKLTFATLTSTLRKGGSDRVVGDDESLNRGRGNADDDDVQEVRQGGGRGFDAPDAEDNSGSSINSGKGNAWSKFWARIFARQATVSADASTN